MFLIPNLVFLRPNIVSLRPKLVFLRSNLVPLRPNLVFLGLPETLDLLVLFPAQGLGSGVSPNQCF